VSSLKAPGRKQMQMQGLFGKVELCPFEKENTVGELHLLT